MHKAYVARVFGLGEHDGVQLFAGARHHLDDVVVTPLRFDVVDADAQRAGGPVERVERFHDHAAGGGFGAGRYGVFQVEEHVVQLQGGSLGHHLFGAAGYGQLTAPGAGGLLGHQGFL